MSFKIIFTEEAADNLDEPITPTRSGSLNKNCSKQINVTYLTCKTGSIDPLVSFFKAEFSRISKSGSAKQ